jgi:hypothetical protein
LILGQFAMKVNILPFPGVNMVDGHRDVGERSARHCLDFTFDVNMARPPRHRDEKEGASPLDWPQKGKREYITEEQVRHVWYLLKKYEYQYQQRR